MSTRYNTSTQNPNSTKTAGNPQAFNAGLLPPPLYLPNNNVEGPVRFETTRLPMVRERDMCCRHDIRRESEKDHGGCRSTGGHCVQSVQNRIVQSPEDGRPPLRFVKS